MNYSKSTLLIVSIILFSFCNLNAQQDKKMFIFGHSLIVHDPPAIATPSNETTVPHWVHFLVQEAGHSLSVSGQYGFLPQHDNLPPISQWGFDHVAPAWDSDTESFSEADFNTILITAGNFIQYQPSNQNYEGPESGTSPLASTLNIIDWIEIQEPNAITYIYENWPDMASFIAGESFPPSTSEFSNYNTYTQNDFHTWWLDYQDFIQADRPNENVRMIPVGPIISKLLTETNLSNIPITDLYEDNAPHGRPTIYFLAGLITYMAIYEEKAPSTYTIPNTVHQLVGANYQSTIDFIWNELLAFNYGNGTSRVFVNHNLSISDVHLNSNINIYPNPSKNYITVNGIDTVKVIELYDLKGRLISTHKTTNSQKIDVSYLPEGLYLLKLKDDNRFMFTRKFIKK